MQPMAMAKGGLADVASYLAAQGRNGDTMLAHITPEEAQLLKDRGGSGTINPVTGLPEFFKKFLKKAWKSVTSVARKVLKSPIGRILATVALATVLGPAGIGLSLGHWQARRWLLTGLARWTDADGWRLCQRSPDLRCHGLHWWRRHDHGCQPPVGCWRLPAWRSRQCPEHRLGHRRHRRRCGQAGRHEHPGRIEDGPDLWPVRCCDAGPCKTSQSWIRP
jgi:hypothetical protein